MVVSLRYIGLRSISRLSNSSDGLLNVLNGLLLNNWLLDILDWLLNYGLLDVLDWLLNLNSLYWLLDNLLLWLVDNLSLNSLIFNSLLDSLLWDVLGVSLLIDLRNILSLVFNGVIVGDSSFMGNNFLTGNFLVVIDNTLDGDSLNVFNSLVLNV